MLTHREQLDKQLGCKLVIIFHAEVAHAAETGLLDFELYCLILEIGANWDADTQEIEGCHNILRHIEKLAPWISWALLSSRLTVKKKLLDASLEKRKVSSYMSALAYTKLPPTWSLRACSR